MHPECASETEGAFETILEAVPEEKKTIVTNALRVIRQESFYSGPIPHPEHLREYESITPGSADRIISMAEKQQEHRIAIEKQVITGQVKDGSRGQVFAFIVFVVGIFVSLCFAYFDMKTFAGVFATSTMMLIIGLFINGRRAMKSDLRSKR